MRTLKIFNTVIPIKDYECSPDGVYLPKSELRLWLYVHITDRCNAACPFCINSEASSEHGFDRSAFSMMLEKISPYVSGISLTGGEPMLDTRLLEDVVAIIDRTVAPDIELDLVTNGTSLDRLPHLRGLERFTTIHLSRHAIDDPVNCRLMRWQAAPSLQTIAGVFRDLPDPGCTVLNCVLQKYGVYDILSISAYLEKAAEIGAANVSFIGMFLANGYCRDNYISPDTLGLQSDERYDIWSRFSDHEYCHCLTGDYRAKERYIRFYYRCPGAVVSPYCRQLVYGTDNQLRQGFGKAKEIV